LHSIAARDLSLAPVPSGAKWPVFAKSMSWILQVCTLQRHIQTGIKTQRPATSDFRHPIWNRCTLAPLCLWPGFLCFG
jgi:hypothetical protein